MTTDNAATIQEKAKAFFLSEVDPEVHSLLSQSPKALEREIRRNSINELHEEFEGKKRNVKRDSTRGRDYENGAEAKFRSLLSVSRGAFTEYRVNLNSADIRNKSGDIYLCIYNSFTNSLDRFTIPPSRYRSQSSLQINWSQKNGYSSFNEYFEESIQLP